MFWRQMVQWVRQNRPLAWVIFLSVALLVFLALLPPSVAIIIWNGLQAQRVLASMLLVFSLLAISLVWSAGQRLDTWAFLYFNKWGSRPPWLDWTMLGFTQIGNGLTALAIALALFLAGDRLVAYELILGTLTLWLVVELVKAIVRRSRPFIYLTQARIVGDQAIGRSFPSGHTSQAFFTATLLVQHFNANIWVAFLLYAVALLVGITRIYVGAHYPRDVLAGAILGSAWGILGGIVDPYIQI